MKVGGQVDSVKVIPVKVPQVFPFPVQPAPQGWGLYLHIPFCERKCPYCDFNTYAGLEEMYERYVSALVKEIRRVGDVLGRPVVRTIFLGGGTPTVLSPQGLEALFRALNDAFAVQPNAEITCEANPGTVDRSRFQVLHELGVNRLSLGAQSFVSEELRFLGRIHDVRDIQQAVDAARSVGFENVNLDLIYGLPGQSPHAWRVSLQRAVACQPTHISCYALTVEEKTSLARWVANGRVPPPDEDLQAELYMMAQDILEEAGYVHYEISNWACPGRMCQHNLIYWRNEPFLGLGAGAHACDLQRRWWLERAPHIYIRRVIGGETTVVGWEELSSQTAMAETMMLGLRLLQEGVSRSRFAKQFGVDPVVYYRSVVARLQAWGLLEVLPDRLRLTPRAYTVANRVFVEFL